ncbi:MAG TPA: aspartate-semialdehyde dehydrogenase [Gemmatimonadaceae bacterium]|nr:aspartate-semialdehyde dehydrogenase [Gemmatimonadaceae bacterium]
MRTAPIPGKRKKKWPVAVLGATGAVGQTFVRLLADHPWFEIAELAASERSAGKKYGETTRWLEGAPPPQAIMQRRIIACDPGVVTAPIVFSALDAAVAGEVEMAFAKAGKFVLSNAKNFRMEPDVPLVIPEVNGDHLALIERQRKNRGWTGAIVTNANCSATVAAVALAPLHQKFGIKKLFLSTMQAVSGAGYPGVPSLDILGNVIPFIADEEPKLEREMLKLLGTYESGEVTSASFKVSAHTNRVPVEHGHTICMTIGFEEAPSPEQAIDAMRTWQGLPATAGLPTRPEHPLVVTDAPDRPQPKRDVNAGDGMTVTVGRVRRDAVLDLRMVALGHNTVRGAAGGSVLNAELLAANGEFDSA